MLTLAVLTIFAGVVLGWVARLAVLVVAIGVVLAAVVVWAWLDHAVATLTAMAVAACGLQFGYGITVIGRGIVASRWEARGDRSKRSQDAGPSAPPRATAPDVAQDRSSPNHP